MENFRKLCKNIVKNSVKDDSKLEEQWIGWRINGMKLWWCGLMIILLSQGITKNNKSKLEKRAIEFIWIARMFLQLTRNIIWVEKDTICLVEWLTLERMLRQVVFINNLMKWNDPISIIKWIAVEWSGLQANNYLLQIPKQQHENVHN